MLVDCDWSVDSTPRTNHNTTITRRSLYSSHVPPLSSNWVTVSRLLLPFSEYSVQVNASNSRGFVLSNTVSVDMPPDSQ